jgi:hypothetical protein
MTPLPRRPLSRRRHGSTGSNHMQRFRLLPQLQTGLAAGESVCKTGGHMSLRIRLRAPPTDLSPTSTHQSSGCRCVWQQIRATGASCFIVCAMALRPPSTSLPSLLMLAGSLSFRPCTRGGCAAVRVRELPVGYATRVSHPRDAKLCRDILADVWAASCEEYAASCQE